MIPNAVHVHVAHGCFTLIIFGQLMTRYVKLKVLNNALATLCPLYFLFGTTPRIGMLAGSSLDTWLQHNLRMILIAR